jgi:RHS repeat-associated protein
MPFGEELGSGIGGRTTGMGYGVADNLRQKFTQKARDVETGLDHFGARYYGSLLARFTSADPLLASGRTSMPQTWNRYAYALNNPLRLIDPDGLMDTDPDTEEQKKREQGQPAQTPPSSQLPPVVAPQTPTGVKIDLAMQANTMLNVPFGGSLFTGVGGFLDLTPTDQDGKSIPNVTVIESVSPGTTIQESNPVTSPSGTITDLVFSGERHPTSEPKTVEQAAAIIVPRLDNPRTITQTHQMSIFSPTSGIMAIATHTRTLTNVDPNGNLVNNVVGNRKVNNYRITDISPVTVIKKPIVMCPRF